jgi:hypothetical protein
MRLIDAELLEEQFGIFDADILAKEEIRFAPTVDAVPVVQCENCAFSQSDGWVCGGTALMPQHRTFPNSFCSDGERKDGGDG